MRTVIFFITSLFIFLNIINTKNKNYFFYNIANHSQHGVLYKKISDSAAWSSTISYQQLKYVVYDTYSPKSVRGLHWLQRQKAWQTCGWLHESVAQCAVVVLIFRMSKLIFIIIKKMLFFYSADDQRPR